MFVVHFVPMWRLIWLEESVLATPRDSLVLRIKFTMPTRERLLAITRDNPSIETDSLFRVFERVFKDSEHMFKDIKRVFKDFEQRY